jgi:nucleoside-diphosphate kinase
MERSLVLVKPDAMQRNLGCTVLSRFEEKGMKLVALRMLRVDDALAKRHYAVHSAKPFFAGLITYITSYPILAAVYEGENAVEAIRKIMGSTDPKKAEAGTIRRDFGIDIERNSIHGSDSKENAEKEINLFFRKDQLFG